ncbi:gb [Venturia nashicola]|uniref:Zinc transporter n=1 Tax=Venturia nashicola TaxID=86259 RepID=A0A4Z1PB06_9PEZI|nr:gb [Venturia nashicola]TLD37665.1 gb [Venturia nashicola]
MTFSTILERPRTPSPPPGDIQFLADSPAIEINEPDYEPRAYTPVSATLPRYASISENTALPQRSPHSPSSVYLSPYSSAPTSHAEDKTMDSAMSQPFDFKPNTEFGRRRGHKFARSSVSHQIILSPTPRSPLQVPQSLPFPTFKEFRASITSEQRKRWLWCTCHLLVAGYVQFEASHSLSMTALSHLLFFDALGAFLCVAVDVGRNFEVWTTGSLRNPFGLERAEVLAGLAMSIILLFMGLDLISHGLTHALENTGGHEPHHLHHHERISPGSVDAAALAAIISTIISATSLGNHARIARAMRPSRLPAWVPSILRNPSHLLTLSCSVLIPLLPLLSIKFSTLFDSALGFTIAMAMVFLGSRLCHALGRMLLMSYSGGGVDELVKDLETDEGVSKIQEAKIWQVHYGLCMASFKVRVGTREHVERVRERIASAVKNRLGGGYGEGSRGLKWEVSSMIAVDRE